MAAAWGDNPTLRHAEAGLIGPVGMTIAALADVEGHGVLPPTPPEMVAAMEAFEHGLERNAVPQRDIPTEHLFHAGMYARTVVMQPGILLTGALMTRATLVIVAGSAAMLVGAEWVHLDGYNVIPASAGRKQAFLSRSEVRITMVFPTQARTVEEAEAEFTEDAARLLSRRQDVNTVVITEE